MRSRSCRTVVPLVIALAAAVIGLAASPPVSWAADPFALQQRLTAPDPSVTQFGDGSALDGDTLAVLSEENSGVVRVYARAGGAWTLQQAIALPDVVYRYSNVMLALSGDTLAIADSGNEVDGVRGAVFVYARAGDRWTLQTTLRDPAGPVANPNEFAAAVALDGDTLVIGAPNVSGSGSGHAYVSTRTPGGWSTPLALVPTGDSDDNNGFGPLVGFGSSVAVSGATVVVGDPDIDGGRGGAHVFVRAATDWEETAVLRAPDDERSPYLGRSVAISGDTIGLGSQNAYNGNGAVYLYTGSGGDWPRTQTIDGGCCGGGVALGLDGDLLAVGVPYGGSGRITTYVRSGDQWTFLQTLRPLADTGNSGFGYSVAVSGGSVAGGSPWCSCYGGGEEYIYVLAPSDLRISKLPAGQPAGVGGQVDQVLSVVNQGSAPALGVVVSDALAPGFTLSGAEAPPGGSCSRPDAGTLRCALGLIPAGGGAVVELRGSAAAAGTYTDTAGVTAGQPADPDLANNTASASVTVDGPAPASNSDLTITKTTGTTTATVGDRITYTLTIRNTGTATTDQLVALDLFSAPVDVVSAAIDGGTCTQDKPIVCRSGPLPGGATRTGTVVAVPQEPGLLRNAGAALGDLAAASVAAPSAQPLADLPNLTATSLRVRRKLSAGLHVTLSSARAARTGAIVTQHVRVVARGSVREAAACYRSGPGLRVVDAPGQVRLAPPAGTRLAPGDTSSSGAGTLSRRTACWRIASLTDGHSRTFTVHLRVLAGHGAVIPTHASALAANAAVSRDTKDVRVQRARPAAPPAVTG